MRSVFLIFPQVGALSEADAREALVKPAMQESVEYAEDAVAEILRQTNGYPYFRNGQACVGYCVGKYDSPRRCGAGQCGSASGS